MTYHLTPERRLQTLDDARAFVDQVGVCHLWPIKDVEMPNLFHAIAGSVRPVPRLHDDPDLSKCWGWKDQALGKRWWYYGKMLRRKATIISLDILPHFYACSDNFGGLEDYLQEYQDGTMTVEAKQIYEALLEHGPLDTIRLRREAWLSGKGSKSRFERALVELQVGLKVLPIGVARAGAWRYAFIYDILQRHFPDLPAKARPIRRSEARRILLSHYLDSVVAADQRMIERAFHVLRWSKSELDRSLDQLLAAGAIRETEGSADRLFVAAWALDRDSQT